MGGICVMIRGQCCNFIPNNTTPDGTITKALQGLTNLIDELAYKFRKRGLVYLLDEMKR
jgi:hypothetical protein